MEILKGIEMLGKALWLPKERILIIADLHIGYEEALNKQGIFVPRMQQQEIKKEISGLLKLKPKVIVINGDLKHEFGVISRQEWQDTNEILDLMLKKAGIVLIKGNHDAILEPIARKKGLEIRDFYCIGSICIFHGDKIRIENEVNDSKVLIIAHEHPAVSLHEGMKVEKYKCFLLGKWKSRRIIVMPSFLPVVEGTDIKKENILSPFLKQNMDDFDVFITGNKIYRFGKLRDIR